MRMALHNVSLDCWTCFSLMRHVATRRMAQSLISRLAHAFRHVSELGMKLSKRIFGRSQTCRQRLKWQRLNIRRIPGLTWSKYRWDSWEAPRGYLGDPGTQKASQWEKVLEFFFAPLSLGIRFSDLCHRGGTMLLSTRFLVEVSSASFIRRQCSKKGRLCDRSMSLSHCR